MRKILLVLSFNIYLFAQNILILNSYSSTLEWTKEQSHTIIDNLQKDKNRHVFVEFMDTKIFKPSKYTEENFLNFYNKKYKGIAFDAVITTDDNALNFVRKYQNTKLFRNSKFFFSGVNNLSLVQKLDKNNFAGVFEEKNPIGNLNIAKKAIKNLKTVYLIGDNSITANKEIIHYKNKLNKFHDINFVYINSKNIEDVISKLKDYDKNSVMMLLVFTSFTKEYRHLNFEVALQLLSKEYKNPMIIHTNVYIDTPQTNIIGGDCTDGKTAGLTIANKAISYLDKKSTMKEIGFSFKEGNKIYFNVKNLHKFNLKVDDFDIINPVLVNKLNSFYDLNKELINITLVIAILIIIFLFIITKKNRALLTYSKDIKNLNNSLEIKIQQALSKLEEQHIQHEEDTIKNTKFSTIGQMAAGITHEINTPLTYIKGTIEMSRHDLKNMPENEYKKELLNDNMQVMSGIKRIGIIIESMREMAQITPSQREEHNVYTTIITVLRMIYSHTKHISNVYINNELFELETSNDTKYIFNAVIHKQRIEQVWTIILNNALDELIKINNFDNRRIDINISSTTDNTILVAINDNAGGIPDNIKDRIFEPFISTKESSGIGIGLNVAKRILDEHNANINVVNMNHGASFRISIPMDKRHLTRRCQEIPVSVDKRQLDRREQYN